LKTLPSPIMIKFVNNTTKTKKCQELYEKIDSLPGCQDIGEIKGFYQEIFSTYGAIAKLICTKDENGKLCPMSKIILEGSNVKLDKEGKEASFAFDDLETESIPSLDDQLLKDTCKSEICINATREYINHIKKGNPLTNTISRLGGISGNKTLGEEINNEFDKIFKEAIDSLDAKNCTVLIQYKSGANSVGIKLSTTLLAIAGLLYYLF